MTANDRVENPRAAKEARGTVAGRSGGTRTRAAEEALKRYLASEAFRDNVARSRISRAAAAGDDEAER